MCSFFAIFAEQSKTEPAMDIDLLAKMVKEAILDNDAVTLPGVGCFVAELMPSTFSDKGYTIHPPYRRLYFSPRQGSDNHLAALYARDNEGVDLGTATRILTEFLAEMKEVLKVRKTVVFPGLGRLRATRENHFFFVADEDLDIYPEGLGLAPVSLKTHVETPEEVASAVAGLADLMEAPVAEEAPETEVSPVVEEPPMTEEPPVAEEPSAAEEPPVAKEEPPVVEEPPVIEEPPVEEIPEQVRDAEPEYAIPVSEEFKETQREEYRIRRRRENWFKALKVFLWVLAGLLVLLLLFILISRVAPNWLDPLLYSREELEILRY